MKSGVNDAAAGSVAEDYVKVIHAHTEWQDQPVTTTVLAARLGLAASSVTEMTKKLVAAGLVAHVPYGAIELTDAGTALALRMLRRHRLIETWLVETFGYRWDEVHDEAEVLEHAVSDRLLEQIAETLGNPTRDPHGDPIPGANGEVIHPAGLPLVDASEGSTVTVVRVNDRDPALLRHLVDQGIQLDSTLVVLGRRPFGGALSLLVGGVERDLGADAAAALWVAPIR